MSKYNHMQSIPIESISKEDIAQAIKEWSEDDKSLEQLLWACYEKGIKTDGCHAGSHPYISFKEQEGLNQITNLLNITQEKESSQILISVDGGNPFGGDDWTKATVLLGLDTKYQEEADAYFDELTRGVKESNGNQNHQLLELLDFFAGKESSLFLRFRHTNDGQYIFNIESRDIPNDRYSYYNDVFTKAGLIETESPITNNTRHDWQIESDSLNDMLEKLNTISKYIIENYSLEAPKSEDEILNFNMEARFKQRTMSKEEFEAWLGEKYEEFTKPRQNAESKNDELQVKLDSVVKLAQSKIVELLSDFSNEQALEKATQVFSACPIVLETIDIQTNEFGKTTQVGGYATPDKIIISQNDIQKLNLDDQQALDNAIGTIIHEYAHKFRQVNSKYGNLFEEASASIFAEMCVNHSKSKNNEQNSELFTMNTSIEYQKAESQVRGILYILKQKNMDISMMTEYVLGDETKFKQTCSQIFGEAFDDYFNQASNTPTHRQNNSVSEELITQILTDYVKNNQLSYKDYWSNDRKIASSTNLYSNGSSVLAQSVVNAGKDAVKDEERPLYVRFAMGSKDYQKKSQSVDDETRERIRNKIEQEYSLSNKSNEDIYDTLLELCSSYIQHKNRTDEESQIYLEELNKIIPNIEEFVNSFRQLRVAQLDSKMVESIDSNNASYNNISSIMNSMLGYNNTQKSNNGNIEAQVDAMIEAMAQGVDVLGENTEEINQSNTRTMGFVKIWVLGIITTLVSIGIIALGIMLK